MTKRTKIVIGAVALLGLGLGGYAYAKRRKTPTNGRGDLMDPYPGVTATPWGDLVDKLKGTVQILGGSFADGSSGTGARAPVHFEEDP